MKPFNAIRRKWRLMFTGSERIRLRDHLKDNLQNKNPPTIKLLDKITFTLGVLNISVIQWFLFVKPNYFWLWYSIIIPILMISRFCHFKALGWHYFMLGNIIDLNYCFIIDSYNYNKIYRFLLLCIDPNTYSIVFATIIINTF